jgi:two-component system nitrogen regulation response regulator GlnG
MLRTTGPLVLSEFLPAAVRGAPPDAPRPADADTEGAGLHAVIDELLRQGGGDLHARLMAVAERALFRRVLQETGGHLGRACERLGLNRSTLRYKLRDLGLSADRASGEESPPPR